MNAVDTNILVYRFDLSEPAKRPIAVDMLNALAGEGNTVLIWQTLGELANQLTYWNHKKRIGRQEIVTFTALVRKMFPTILPTPAVLDIALDLSDRYSLSHWDSMLLGACIDAGVTTLYTEDIGAPRKIDSLELVNPF